jgi:BirA family transcriptional regulator, biotin operon repressor / biotin---[acetyl-CoA-carboxylase] ligase
MWSVAEIPTCDSTQNWAFAQIAANPVQSGFAVYTLAQTAGVGRQGHTWLDSGHGLALSLGWPETTALRGWPAWISLAVAETAMVLYGLTPSDIGLKWPNDLMAEGKKLGGVLVHQKRLHGRSWLVAGVGLNLRWVRPPPQGMAATDLSSLVGRPIDPGPFVAALVERCAQAVAHPTPELWAQRFYALDVFRGQEVSVTGPQGRAPNAQERSPGQAGAAVNGRYAAMDAEGRIGIQTVEGLHFFGLGELSLRRAGEDADV